MLAPDVSYCMYGMMDSGQITGDTLFYFQYIDPKPNDTFDRLSLERGKPRVFKQRHWISLGEHALLLEDQYVKWRSQNSVKRFGASYYGYECVKDQLVDFVNNMASFAADYRRDQFDTPTIDALDRKFGLMDCIHVFRRTMARLRHDLNDLDQKRLTEARMICDHVFDEHRARYDVALEEIRNEHRITPLALDHSDDIKRTVQYIQREIKKDRKIIKRSVKFAQKLLGHDTTRMFISGDGIRIEGNHCLYEIKKYGRMLDGHGATLSVFTKEGDIHLCNMCIFTPKVPLMDHVASLVMHIRAGEEDEIFKAGNLSKIHDSAYDLEWLAPHLPEKVDPSDTNDMGNQIRAFMIANHPSMFRDGIPTPQEHVLKMRREVAAFLINQLGRDNVPFVSQRLIESINS